MIWTTIRFAKIENKIDGERLKRLLEGIKSYRIRGQKPNRIGFLKPENIKGGIVFRFYKDIRDTTNVLDDKNIDLTDEGFLNKEFKRVIIFNDGYVAYENPKIGKSSSEEIFSLIQRVWELNISKEEELKITKINQFPYKSLKNFYKEANRIISVTLKDIGKTPPNPHWPTRWLKEIVENLGEQSEKLEINSGRETLEKKRDLKKAKIIDAGLMPISKPVRIRGKSKDNELFDIRISGILSASFPDDEDQMIEKFVRLCRKVIEGFVEFES